MRYAAHISVTLQRTDPAPRRAQGAARRARGIPCRAPRAAKRPRQKAGGHARPAHFCTLGTLMYKPSRRVVSISFVFCVLLGALGVWTLLHPASVCVQPWRAERTATAVEDELLGPYP